MRHAVLLQLLTLIPAPLVAQPPTPAQQVAAAVLPLPESMRTEATVPSTDAGDSIAVNRSPLVCTQRSAATSMISPRSMARAATSTRRESS